MVKNIGAIPRASNEKIVFSSTRPYFTPQNNSASESIVLPVATKTLILNICFYSTDLGYQMGLFQPGQTLQYSHKQVNL